MRKRADHNIRFMWTIMGLAFVVLLIVMLFMGGVLYEGASE